MSRHNPKAPVLTPTLLRQSRLFEGIEESTLERLAVELPVQLVSTGERIMTEGESASDLFVVISGELEVTHKGNLDHDVRVALLGPGDWVGEMAVLDIRPRSASVRTLAPTAVLRVTASHVQQLFDQDPTQYGLLMRNLARELCRRLRVADRVIANSSLAVSQRYVRESRRPAAP